MVKDKRITFIINTMQHGGAAKMIAFVANTIAEYCKHVEFIILFDVNKTEKLDEKIKQFPLGLPLHGVFDKIALILHLRRQIKLIDPDIVCAFVSDVAFYGRLATLGQNREYFSAERGDPYTLPKKWKKRIRWTYRHSDKCIFQTEEGKNYFDTLTQKKSVIIPNPYIPTSIEEQVRNGVKKKSIAAAGRLVNQKGFDVLIRSFKNVHELHPDYSLILYGEGTEKKKLQELADNLGLSEVVHFAGYVSDLQSNLTSDEIFVLSSRFEGIPNALIEAMAIGMPCIATDCTPGGPKMLIGESERGLLVPVNDEENLSIAICKLIEDKELRNFYANEAIKVKDMLAIDRIKERWFDCFELV